MRRIRLDISYDGTDFCGWQRQKHDNSIQGELERALSRMCQEDICVHGAGRTDAGVHAEGMVAHFTTTSTIGCEDFFRGLNSMLPYAIRVLNVGAAREDFHARFSAKGKRYHYQIYTGTVHPPHIRLYNLHVTAKLNFASINQCLQYLVGTHDFTSFENTGSRDKDDHSGRGAVRTLFEASLLEKGNGYYTFEFIGDGFLKNMVRNLVGTLLEVGRGKIDTEEFIAILHQKNRAMGGPTAPPHGLFLKEVLY